MSCYIYSNYKRAKYESPVPASDHTHEGDNQNKDDNENDNLADIQDAVRNGYPFFFMQELNSFRNTSPTRNKSVLEDSLVEGHTNADHIPSTKDENNEETLTVSHYSIDETIDDRDEVAAAEEPHHAENVLIIDSSQTRFTKSDDIEHLYDGNDVVSRKYSAQPVDDFEQSANLLQFATETNQIAQNISQVQEGVAYTRDACSEDESHKFAAGNSPLLVNEASPHEIPIAETYDVIANNQVLDGLQQYPSALSQDAYNAETLDIEPQTIIEDSIMVDGTTPYAASQRDNEISRSLLPLTNCFILLTGLSREMDEKIRKLATELGATILSTFEEHVTHVLTLLTDDCLLVSNTLKVMLGIACGKVYNMVLEIDQMYIYN